MRREASTNHTIFLFGIRVKRFITLSAVAAGCALLASTPGHARDTITRELATLDERFPVGSIVVDTKARKLYYALGNSQAISYRIAVGKTGFAWTGETFVQKKRKNPGWSPTARMRRLGAPRYVPPGPRNPLGIRAIYLGWSEYRIHGTNAPTSIGRAASSGCFRMHNDDVADLYERVHIGAPVYVLKSLDDVKQKTALRQ